MFVINVDINKDQIIYQISIDKMNDNYTINSVLL